MICPAIHDYAGKTKHSGINDINNLIFIFIYDIMFQKWINWIKKKRPHEKTNFNDNSNS